MIGMSDDQSLAEPAPDLNRVLWLGATGAAFTAIAALVGVMGPTTGLDGPRVVLTLLGLIIAGAALSQLPGSRPVWGLFAAAALLANGGFPATWDSFRVVAGVLFGAALLGLLWLTLPARGRLVSATIFVFFQFLGIATAITGPHGQPWLFGQLWGRLYRPYLQFTNLDNAYNFFCPDPGPAFELWFCIYYADRPPEWVIVPRRADSFDPLFSSYYRRIKIPEMAGQGYEPGFILQSEAISIRSERDAVMIPRHPEQVANRQFRIPNNFVQRMLIPSYVQHVAADHDPAAIRGISVYVVTHDYTTPEQFVAARDAKSQTPRRITPDDPSTYLPFYLGSYQADGRLLPGPDGLRWWMIPITAKPGAAPPPVYFREMKKADYVNFFNDFVEIHAGSDGYRKGP